jgi:hypothetical protein
MKFINHLTNLKKKMAMILEVVAPTALIFISLCVFSYTLYHFTPVSLTTQNRESWEDVLIKTQLERADNLAPKADIVITGDSSSLMGLDALKMEKMLNISVQSFATMGFVGPEGYAAIVQRYKERAPIRKIKILIIQLQRLTFSDNEKNYNAGYEDIVLSKKSNKNFIFKIKDPFISEVYKKKIEMPLRGPYRDFYTAPEDIEKKLITDHGTMIDPRQTDDSLKPINYNCEISDSYLKRLIKMKERIDIIDPSLTILFFTPTPKNNILNLENFKIECGDSFKKIAEVLKLNKKNNYIELNEMEPKFFANYYHLNAQGREWLTNEIVLKLLSMESFNETINNQR